MPRIDLHIVRAFRGWLLQNANGRTLGTFGSVDAAIQHGEATARQIRMRGVHARLTIHLPGKRPNILEFPAVASTGLTGLESYALTRCGFS
jgi:hypothetical protein